MLLFLLLNTLILVIFILWRRTLDRFRGVNESIPGPPKHFLLGNLSKLRNNISGLLEDTGRLFDRYGSVVRIWLGPFHMKIFVIDPKYMEFFLTSNIHTDKSSDVKCLLKPCLGQGLLTSSGSIWSQHRKAITPAFHFNTLQSFIKSFNNLTNRLVSKLITEVDKDINIYKFMRLFAMDAICESSLKYNLNSLGTDDSKIVDVIRNLTETFFLRFCSVVYKLYLIFRFSPLYKKHAHSLNILNGFTKEIINNRKENRDHTTRDNPDKAFIDIMLDNDNFDDIIISNQISTFLYASIETMSTLLSLSLVEMAKHSDIQKRILNELEEVGHKNGDITMEQVNRMSYLDRVIKECLRLYSPIPFIERTVVEDVEFDGVKIPKGTVISFQILWMHRRADIYPDPETFDPDRFLPANVAKRHIYSFLPFSAGPRNCIGQKYAVLNAKIAIANIVRNFELLPVNTSKVSPNDGDLKLNESVAIRLNIRS